MIFIKHDQHVFAHDKTNPFKPKSHTDRKRPEDGKREPETKRGPESLLLEDLASPLLEGAQGEETLKIETESMKRAPERDPFSELAKNFYTNLPERHEAKPRIEYLNQFKRALTTEIHQINSINPIASDSEGSSSAEVSVLKVDEVAQPCLGQKQVLGIMLIVFVIMGTCWFVFDEGNSIVDALYMVIIIITTVGYGMDEFMEDDRNQIFLIFYIIFGVALITTFLNIMFVGMLDGLAKKQLRFFDAGDSDCFTDTTVTEEHPNRCCGLCSHQTWEKFIGAMSSTTAMILTWVLVLLGGSFWIGIYEDWSALLCVYFAVVSGSTVGFGDYAPESQEGRLVCIIWLPICIALTANAFGTIFSGILSAFYDERMKELAELRDICEDLLNEDNFEDNLALMDIDGDGELTEAEFITQTLINEYAVPPKKLQLIKAYFEELDVDRGGSITIDDFKLAVEKRKKKGKQHRIERVDSGGENLPDDHTKYYLHQLQQLLLAKRSRNARRVERFVHV